MISSTRLFFHAELLFNNNNNNNIIICCLRLITIGLLAAASPHFCPVLCTHNSGELVPSTPRQQLTSHASVRPSVRPPPSLRLFNSLDSERERRGGTYLADFCQPHGRGQLRGRSVVVGQLRGQLSLIHSLTSMEKNVHQPLPPRGLLIKHFHSNTCAYSTSPNVRHCVRTSMLCYWLGVGCVWERTHPKVLCGNSIHSCPLFIPFCSCV